MNRTNLIFSLFVVLLAFGGAYAQNQSVPPMPFVDKGACPFECCTYREWTVLKPTAVKREMKSGSETLFNLRQGDRVRGVSGVVITTKPGVVKVLKDTKVGEVNVKKGETIYLLTYLGEGFHKIWRKGKMFEGDIFPETGSLKIIDHSIAVWWVKIKNRRGQIGWSRQPDNFGNKDECGN